MVPRHVTSVSQSMMPTPKVQIRKLFVKGTKRENLSTKELKKSKSTEGDGAREEWVAAVGWREVD